MLKLKPISSVVAALMIASALSGCGGEAAVPTSAPSQTTSDSAALAAVAAEEAAAATKAAVEAAVAEATKVAEEAAAVEAAKVAKAAAASDAKAAAAAKAAPAPAPVPEVFKMPNLVGENLQLAQDKLQALGSYVLDQEDAAGLSRIQVLDSNWQVCSQNPAPGKRVPVETVVLLTSVKLAELCP